MNKQCKQRQELLDFNAFIEARNGLGRVRQEQLKVWLEVEDYDEKTGDVYTRAGIFNKKDLQFRGGTNESNSYSSVLGECTYFDQRKTCDYKGMDGKLCGARPVMRKTGKCTPHSVHPFDMSRVDDWIDCYQGCLKHDPVAREKYREKLRANGGELPVYTEPIRIPNIERLCLYHKHKPEFRQMRLGKVLDACLESRNISRQTTAALLGITVNTLSQKIGGKGSAVFSFMEVCDIIAFLRLFDQRKKIGH